MDERVGGSERPRPRSTRKQGTTRRRIDEWDEVDYGYYSWPRVMAHKYKVRRRRTKLRVKAMTRGRRFTRRLMITGTWFLGLVAALMVAVIVMYYQFTDVPRPEDIALPQVATIEYSDGSTLARIGSQDRTIVDLAKVPQSTRWAVLAAEDRNFYSNGAVSITGTLRAAAVDVTGGERQGGSGITQQYVKNAYLNDDPSLTRKLKELMIAVKLSRDYTKDDILGFYLNTVYFGRGAYGIEAAAEAYFGKDVSKLTVAEGALLAGVLRAPSYYDPAINPTAAKQRWAYVIQGMVDTGHLSAEQATTIAFPKTRQPTSTGLGVSGWKWLLVNAVLSELSEHGIDADEVDNRGLVVRTTIDPRAQNAAVNAIQKVFAHPTKKQRNLKNSLVAVDPDTGGILAYYAGTGPGVKGLDGKVDYNDWAQQRANSPGSTFKPFVLAAVLNQTVQDKGSGEDIDYAINSDVPGNKCLTIEGTKICNDPSDADESGSSVTISHAMRYSLNTSFDWLADNLGPDKVASMAHQLGVAATNSDGQPTLVDTSGANKGDTTFGIGIGDYPATTLDMASGYATLADDGLHNSTYLVQSATGSDGSVVYRHDIDRDQVLDARIANDVTLTLEPILGDSDLSLNGGRVAAAKTGTEGVSGNSTNNSDAWMVGYTPQVSAAVWVGTGARQPIYNSDGQPMYGKDEPGHVWQQFMNNYLKAIKATKLPMATRQLLNTKGQTIKQPTYTPNPTTYAPQTSSAPATSSAPTTQQAPPTQPTTPVVPTTPVNSAPPTQPSDAPTSCGILGCAASP